VIESKTSKNDIIYLSAQRMISMPYVLETAPSETIIFEKCLSQNLSYD
jgi:hypothetical protein